MAEIDLLNGSATEFASTDFDEWLKGRDKRTAFQASTVLEATRTTVSPEEATRRRAASSAAQLVLGTAVPVSLLADPGVLAMVESKVAGTRAMQVFTAFPKVAEWFGDPDNAAVASDMLPEVGALAGFVNQFARGADRTIDDAIGSGLALRSSAEALGVARDAQSTFEQLREEERAKSQASKPEGGFRAELMKGKTFGGAPVSDPSDAYDPIANVKAAKRWLDSRIFGMATAPLPVTPEEMEGLLEDQVAASAMAVQRDDTERQRMFPAATGAAEVGRMIETIPEDATFTESAATMLGIVTERPGDFVGFLAGVVAESGLPLVASGVTLLATRNPVAARLALFGTAVPNARGSNALELAADMGYDLTKPADARRLAESEADLGRMIDASGTYAVVVSMIDAVTAGMGSAMAKTPVGSFVVEALAQAVAGGGGEIIARMVSGQKWTWTEAILEGLAEMVTAPLEAAGIGIGTVKRRYTEAKVASDRRVFFKSLSEGAVSSELRKRSPDHYKSAIEKLTADGPLESVYIDAGRMEALFQDAPEQLQQLFEAVPDLDYRAFQKAAETGSVFAIPTALYATAIAGTEIDARITDHLRVRADRLSYAEAQEAMAQVEQELKGFEDRLKELESTAELDPAAQAEYENLVTQLVVAGRAPGVARGEAAVLASVVSTMAQRQGITTAEYVRRNIVPTIRRDGSAEERGSVRVMRMDDLTSALADPGRATLPEFMAIADELAEQNLTPETATEEDVRLAAIAVADRGGLVSNLDEEFLLTPSGIYRATPGEQMMQTVSLRNGEEDLSAYGHTPGKRIGTRALALIMQKRQRALYGKIGRKDFSPKTVKKMANWMADEIEFELQTPDAAADGWYTTKFQAALDIMAQRFPEFDTTVEWQKPDAPGLAKITSAYEARQLMTMIIAVTSNGAKVADNYKMAVDVYEQLRATGSIQEFTGVSDRGGSTAGHLNIIVDMLAQYDTFAELSSYLLADITVAQLNKELKAAGATTLTKMPSTARVPRAAAIFGPKLGAFMANLSGADGYLTMDLWWTRTINRYRGDVLPRVSGLKNAVNSKGEPVGLHRFKWLVGQPDLTDSQALKLVIDHAQRYRDKKWKNGTEAEMAANTIYKDAFVKLQESPLSANERGFMIEVAAAARDELEARTGRRYSIADVQALIWYYEKRLMADMGAKASGDISYEEAAQRAVAGPVGVPGKGTDTRADQEDDRFEQGAKGSGDGDAAGGAAAGGAVGDVVGAEGLTLVHGGAKGLTLDGIEVVRSADKQKQGKRGRSYGGFYATAEADAAQAAGYAGADGAVYDIRLKPGTRVLRKDGDVTRLSQADIERWVADGYGLVVGKDPRGRTEYVVIDKDAVSGVSERGNATPRDGRLPDLEPASPGPVAGVREVASRYMTRMGLPVRHQSTYVKVDKERAAEIARLYDEMPDAPNDPEVKRAYEALAQETVAQYDALLELGFTFEWITGDDPYASPAEAIKDMQENKHLWVFPTDSGFGTLNEASAANPLLQMSGRIVDGREARINDLFRIVHDVFGHGSEGASFGARGEENAWQAHVRMFSPLAARAMTTETRGQNSWVNFGPYGEQNRKDPKSTVFADQKVGLLPPWVSTVGQAEDVPNGTLYQAQPDLPEGTILREDGQPLTLYHGTNRVFSQFRDGEIFLTSRRGLATEHALREGATGQPRVIEATVALLNPLEIDTGGVEPDVYWMQNTAAIRAQVAEGGHDGVMIVSGSELMVVAQSAQQVTQFDPRRFFQGAPGLAANDIATPADFDGELKLSSFRKRGWFIVSATQSHFGDWDSAENAAEAERARRFLKDNNLAYREVTGRYAGTDDGPSFLVFGDETTWGQTMRREFRQESIISRRGIVYSPYEDRKPVPITGLREGAALNPTEDYQTTLPDGRTFTLDLDWPDPKSDDPRDDLARRGDGLVEMVHWSPRERSTIDPKHAGKGKLDGPERHRAGPNKAFFGLNQGKRNTAYRRESSALGGLKHTVAIDPARLYPWDTDPDGLREKIDGTLPPAQQIGAYEKAIKKAGYAGYFVIDGPLGDVAAVFEALPVEKVEVDDALYQSDEAYFKSALAQAILEAKQETAPAQDWLKIIPKLPGVKKAELEWTGLTAWLEGHEPTRKLTRQHIYHWLSSAQVQVDVQYGPGAFETYTERLSAGRHDYLEVLITVPNLDEIGPNAGREVVDTVANSGHFDTSNIVVHARVQVAGKTLFIDEVQSDLNSFWRKRGGQAQALAPVADEVRAEVEAYIATQNAEQRAYQAKADARGAVEGILNDFTFGGALVRAAQVWNALFMSSRTISNLAATPNITAFDAMLGVLIQRENRSLINLAVPDSVLDPAIGAAARGAASADLYAMVMDIARLERDLAAAQDRTYTARRGLSRAAIDLYEGGTGDTLPLPLSPFEGESAVQLAMKYLTTYAAREGFTKIAWTPGYMQMKRWNVQEQRAQGAIASYMVLGHQTGARVVGLRLEDQRTASFTVDADGQVIDTGVGFPPALIDRRNIREILPAALAERIMRPFPEGETMMSEDAADFPEVNLSDNAGQGYRIVYDQQMKRFLEKWAGKFGARVESDTSVADQSMGTWAMVRVRDALESYVRAAESFDELRRIVDRAEQVTSVADHALDEIREKLAGYPDVSFLGAARSAVNIFFARYFTTDEAVSLAIDLGVAPPREGKPVWALELTDEFRAEASKPQPLFQRRPDGARGQIILPPAGSDAAPEITVFDKADLSTVLHEGGHWMLWLLQTGESAGDQFSSESMQAVRGWFAGQAESIAEEVGLIAPQVLEYLTRGTTGAADVDAAVRRGLHERFARGFEAYMREGKAPTIALRGVFHRFAAWLMEIYRSARALRVELTDEVRQVFDKMIATDAQLAEAQQLSVGAEQIAATAKAMGLDEASYAELVRLQDEERAEAFGLALRETMAPIMAQRSAEARALRNELTKRISAEVNAQRHNRAFEWLANGRWVGSADAPDDLPADLRMDPYTLAEEYGDDMLDKLPRGRRPMTRVGGLSADEAAGWFGYDSGADMLADLTTKPRARDEIKQRVQAELAEHLAAQDPRDAAETTAAVVDALHGEKRGQVLAAELRAINRVSSRKKGAITSRQQAAQIARDIIARTPARDAIRSDLYAQQARTYGEQAARALAAGDTDAAFEAKRRQLIQHSLYVESRKAAALVAQVERKAARLKRTGTRKNLAGEYLEAIDDILYTYDFRKMSAAAEKKRGGLLRYVEMMVKAGRENELAIPDHVLTNAKRVPYKTLSIQRLQGILDTLANIEHTARLKKKLLDKQRERDMDAVVADIEDAFRANIGGRPPARVPTGAERVRDAVKEFVNYASNADTLLRRIDGWVTGAVYRHLKSGIDRASADEVAMRLRASAELDRLFAPYAKFERRRMAVRRMWSGYDQSLSKWDLISIALNAGNKDNWERLTSRDNPNAMRPEQAKALLEHLDERDWRFVQSVWDHLDAEYWPQIAAREKRTTGVAPKKVEAMLMVEGLPGMPAGITGGYYPIVYDRRFSAKVAEEKHQEIQTAMQAGRFGKAQTRNGHTKERAAGSGGRTVELGIHVLFGHVNQVIHDLALSEEVANAWKIMQDPRVKGLFERAGMLQDHASLEVWLQDVAAGQIVAGGVLGRIARHAKSGFTVSKLAFNMSTVAIQFTGLAQSMAFLGKRRVAKAYSSYVAQGVFPAARRIKARSAFMAERERTFQRDIFDLVGEVNNTPVGGRFADARALLMAAGFWAMQKVQFYVVDAPTWMAGYEQGRAEGMTDDEAVQSADRAVARAQASGVYADRTAIERGTLGRDTRQNEFLRLFTALGSYMFAKFNVAQEIAGRTGRAVADPNKSSIAALLNGTVDMLLIFTVEAVLYNLIKGTLPGDDDDEDEQSWLAFLAAETALSAMGTLPFIRDMSSVLQGFDGGGAYGGVLETVGKPFVQLGQGELDKQLYRSVNDLVGLSVPGYPATAIWRLIEAEAARRDGEEVSPVSYIMGLPR